MVISFSMPSSEDGFRRRVDLSDPLCRAAHGERMRAGAVQACDRHRDTDPLASRNGVPSRLPSRCYSRLWRSCKEARIDSADAECMRIESDARETADRFDRRDQ